MELIVGMECRDRVFDKVRVGGGVCWVFDKVAPLLLANSPMMPSLRWQVAMVVRIIETCGLYLRHCWDLGHTDRSYCDTTRK